MRIDKAMEYLNPSKGVQLILYIAQYTDGNTKIFSRTYNQIQKDTGISQVTIAKIFKDLESKGLMIHVSQSKWLIPAVEGYSDSSEGPGWFVESKL